MRIAARWGLGAVLAVVLACQGPPGPKGDPGPPGPQGDPGTPRTSVGGLSGGQINGDVNVTGAVSADGRLLTYPRSPMILTGVSLQGCIPANFSTTNGFADYRGMVEFPVTFNLGTPVMLATFDRNDIKARWPTVLEVFRVATNRTSFWCDRGGPAIHWLAIDRGVHTISVGPQTFHIEARTFPLTQQTGDIGFDLSTSFRQPGPAVFLFLEGRDGNAATSAYVVSNSATDHFTYALNAAPTAGQRLHWIAMDRGTYIHKRYKWTADSDNKGSCPTGCPINISGGTSPNVLLTATSINQAASTLPAQVIDVTSAQFSYTIDTNSTNVQGVNYLTIEDLPEVVSLP